MGKVVGKEIRTPAEEKQITETQRETLSTKKGGHSKKDRG